MKKSNQIVISALLLAALLVIAGVVWLLFGQVLGGTDGNAEGKGMTIFNAKGEEMIIVKTPADIYGSEYWAYLEIVVSEAQEIIAQKENCKTQEAYDRLFADGYQVYTAFDPVAYTALTMVSGGWGETCDTAAVITDLNGGLLAVNSSDVKGRQINYTQERRSPYSSFKALSVYTPAIENEVVNWASMYEDSPYKQLEDKDGQPQGWPANASGTYSQADTTVYDALRKSLNTVAVKCLKDVGITKSMEFLRTNFGIPLKEETYVVQAYGEEEVIGNIALGYLETGITPVEMAGYYQIFANGGVYTAPASIQKICAADGADLYVREQSSKQVISETTADLMNKLLQGVVADGGTGESAQVYDVEIAGKTGTGDNYADNWFVGVTPGYSIAVWHGQHSKNEADDMFAAVIWELYNAMPNANRKFITHKNLHQIVYCAHSGKAVSSACARIDIGYFNRMDALPVCDVCNKS